ncbi:hypothetical protein C4D60_Mb01t24900 [Musa balbisiana]|uniref:Uncharacterized protein n=1 Tax=Musa balbisiana TaxID=52838 RepID=A0A4S8JQ08_MUSBA|nr:hypothetical protein C4D60_Mb01t24900 [Musa balbisiana]
MAAAESLEEKQADATQAPRPRSPPRYTDLCGRHRLQARVQLLSREIGFLEVSLCFPDLQCLDADAWR